MHEGSTFVIDPCVLSGGCEELARVLRYKRVRSSINARGSPVLCLIVVAPPSAMLLLLVPLAFLAAHAVMQNCTGSCEDKDSLSWLQSRHLRETMGSSKACDCVYIIQSGDTCWAIAKDYFGVEYPAVQVISTGETCPKAELFVGSEVCVTGPTKGKEKCEGGPEPGPKCIYIVQKGDTCWTMAKDYFDVPYSSITDMRSGEKCPCELWEGDEMQIENPAKGLEKLGPRVGPYSLFIGLGFRSNPLETKKGTLLFLGYFLV